MIGEFHWRKRGAAWRRQRNLVTTEGRNWMDGQEVASSAIQLYCAPFGNNVTPAANWTAATFPVNAGELMDAPEGYSEATRQEFSPVAYWEAQLVDLADRTGDLLVNNYEPGTVTYSPMSFRIRSATTINVYGFGMLTVATKGDTTGVLFSAMRFAAAPEIYRSGDILDIYYTLRHAAP